MNTRFVIVSAVWVCLLLNGCSYLHPYSDQDSVELIKYGPDSFDISINKILWEGIVGIHGYVGYSPSHYWAGLRGSGPVYINPIFQDNPPRIKCVGTITLDRARNSVVVKMNRIISKEGEPLRTTPHPANGTYPIQSTRKPFPDEQPLH